MSLSASDPAAQIAAHRLRYEQLKAAGQHAGLPLPPPSPRPPPPAQLLHREVIPAGWYWTTRLTRGQRLRIINTSATPGVSFFAWNADDTSERYNAGDTVKVQWTAALARGRVLLSDMGRVLASIVEDSCGMHDALLGGSAPQSGSAQRNTRENLVLAAGKHGLSRRDIGPCLTFFAPVQTDAQGAFHWREAALVEGDYVELRAEMNLLVALSNCPHPLAPDAEAADIEVLRLAAQPLADDDLCRHATAEARRAFENTDALFNAQVRS